mmetsp:Transcript_61544/g.187997  ORF Transcript_61544/g.187997 Transcript_61544/m.187997 type:complete len:307 (+) Transcript_61544:900-1820(+)
MQALPEEHPFRPEAMGQRSVQRLLRRVRKDLQDLPDPAAPGADALGHPAVRPVLRVLQQDVHQLHLPHPDRRAPLGHGGVRRLLRCEASEQGLRRLFRHEAQEQGFRPGRAGHHRGAICVLRGPRGVAALLVFADPGVGLPTVAVGRLRSCANGRERLLDVRARAAGPLGGLPGRAGGVLWRHADGWLVSVGVPERNARVHVRARLGGAELAARSQGGPGHVLREARGAGGVEPRLAAGVVLRAPGRLRRPHRVGARRPRVGPRRPWAVVGRIHGLRVLRCHRARAVGRLARMGLDELAVQGGGPL